MSSLYECVRELFLRMHARTAFDVIQICKPFKYALVFEIHSNVFIVLPIRPKTCRANDFCLNVRTQ